MRYILLLIAGTLLVSSAHITNASNTTNSLIDQSPEQICASLTLEQKIAQLCMLAVRPDYNPNITQPSGPAHVAEISNVIQQYQVGGIIVFKTNRATATTTIQNMQTASTIPLLVGIDGEWGTAERIIDATPLPKHLTLGAVTDDTLIYQAGLAAAAQAKNLGIALLFAPVVDLVTHPTNPVIGYRSFGDEPERVAHCASLFAKGIADGGATPCIKHFPGHGTTITDSHIAMPIVDASIADLQKHLFPFTSLAKNIPAIMIGHLHVPAIDPTPNQPASTSSTIINQLLRHTIGFKGLIITDALDMHGATAENSSPGQCALNALQAGNDILLMPEDIASTITTIVKAVRTGTISESAIDTRVIKILRLKQKMCITKKEDTDAKPLSQSIADLRTSVYRAALTNYCDSSLQLPLSTPIEQCASVQIGGKSTFASPTPHTFLITIAAPEADWEDLAIHLKNYKTVIVHLCATTEKPGCFGQLQEPDARLVNFIQKISAEHMCIFALYTTPFVISLLPEMDTLLVAYEHTSETWQAVWDAIEGKLVPQGKLPVSVSPIN